MTRPRVTTTLPPIVAAKLAILAKALGAPPSAVIRALIERAVDDALQRYGIKVKEEEIATVMKRLRWVDYLSKREAERAAEPVF